MDLDTKDEAEMLRLAVFFQTMLDKVPVPDGSTKSSKHLDVETEGVNIDEIEVTVRTPHTEAYYHDFDVSRNGIN